MQQYIYSGHIKIVRNSSLIIILTFYRSILFYFCSSTFKSIISFYPKGVYAESITQISLNPSSLRMLPFYHHYKIAKVFLEFHFHY